MKLLIKFIFKTFQWVCLFSCLVNSVKAQIIYPQNYFRSPLDIPLKLAGNFGEIRTNHFHSGLDLKTDSVVGKEVFAAADGYIVRIKISTSGFGKAIYINHPNGYTTVYGHLHHFADSINAFAIAEEYKKESFEVELFPDSNQFPVKKGDLIAWSGNTGGSEGPHLHFEIRNTKTEKPINPLLFGFEIPDSIAPSVKSVLFRPIKEQVLKEIFPPVQVRLSDIPGVTDTVELIGQYGFEFKGYDLANEGPNRLGIYSITLSVNDSVYYQLTQSTFSFDETRYANAHVDYDQKYETGEIFERCYRLPGDLFSLNQVNLPGVLIDAHPGKMLTLLLELKDFNNNITTKKIIVKGVLPFDMKKEIKKKPLQKNKKSIHPKPKVLTYHLKWDVTGTIRAGAVSIIIPKGSLYDDAIVKYYEDSLPRLNAYNEPYFRFNRIPPLHSNAILSIKKAGFPDSLKTKAVIAQVINNHNFVSMGGIFKNDSIVTKIRSLGTFTILADTLTPVIDTFQISHDSIFNTEILSIKITDDLSGIASYKATIDGKWILMEFDEKTSTLFYTYHDFAAIENKELIVEVIDKCGNRALYQTIIKN